MVLFLFFLLLLLLKEKLSLPPMSSLCLYAVESSGKNLMLELKVMVGGVILSTAILT